MACRRDKPCGLSLVMCGSGIRRSPHPRSCWPVKSEVRRATGSRFGCIIHPWAAMCSYPKGALLSRAGVAGGRRRVVLLLGRAEQLLEDWLQRVGPDLISLHRGMKLVRVHHAVEQPSI